jgi:hypothetical protein
MSSVYSPSGPSSRMCCRHRWFGAGPLDRGAGHAHSARLCTRNAEDFVGIKGLGDVVTVWP